MVTILQVKGVCMPISVNTSSGDVHNFFRRMYSNPGYTNDLTLEIVSKKQQQQQQQHQSNSSNSNGSFKVVAKCNGTEPLFQNKSLGPNDVFECVIAKQ